MDELVKALRAGEKADMDGTLVKVSRQACEEAADAIEALQAENARLRKLDVEYGRVETAIIMADPHFDGDSDHANCGDRLIASVQRMKVQIAEVRDQTLEDADADFLDEAALYFERRDTGGEDMAHWSNMKNAENCRRIAAAIRAMKGERG